VPLGAIAQEVVEEATSVLGHLINVLRQGLMMLYDFMKTVLRLIYEKPMEFTLFAVNMAILLGS